MNDENTLIIGQVSDMHIGEENEIVRGIKPFNIN